jgi:zinc/manganese transport system substrate-binding protein
MPATRIRRRALELAALLGATLALSACGAATTTGGSGTIPVVAAQNFWGSIVAQLGGNRVSVTSIVTDPNADPHEYETSAADARAFADASYVVLNGAGYDTWAQKLLDANPASGRAVLTVAGALGRQPGDDPHFWYSPDDVKTIADHITADLTSIAPARSAYFAAQRTVFESALAPYHQLITSIRTRYAATPVGATESIFVYLASALGLDLISPPAFMQAVAEGNDPPVQAVATMRDQVRSRSIAVLVYNVQTVTVVTTGLQQLAGTSGVAVVGISETMPPSYATFEDWQVAQLTALQHALAGARSGA